MPIFEPGNFTVGGLVGLILGAYLGHVLTIRRNNMESIRKGYNESAKNFRDSFACVFQALHDGIDSIAYTVINNFKTQETSMLEFARFLEGETKNKFEKKWNNYKECYKEFLTDYNVKCTEPEFIDEFNKFITELLEFAKHK